MRLRIDTPIIILIFTILITTFTDSLYAQEKFTFQDVMQFKSIDSPVISDDGDWIAFGIWPERGDGEVRIRQTEGNTEYVIDRGERPQISSNSKWVAAIVKPPFLEFENADNNGPKNSLVVLNIETGERQYIEEVRNFEFSNNGDWLVVTLERPDDFESDNPNVGYHRQLTKLQTQETLDIQFVNEMSIDSTSAYFVYSISDTLGENNALFAIALDEGPEPVRLLGKSYAH